MNPAIVYDAGISDHGTPYYFRYALAQVLGYDPDWYSQCGPMPKHDFYIHIDDGRDDLTDLPPDPWVYYCTDSHLGPGPRLEKAKHALITFCAQKPFAEELKAQGLNAQWLPLACSPQHHPTAEELGKPLAETRYDIAFVGHIQDPEQTNRIEFLGALFRAFPNFRFRFGAFHSDMAREYHAAKIGMNHAVRDDLNMRFFELASLGVPQLCDRRMVGLEELGFFPGVDFIPYSNADEAIVGIEKYLDHPQRPTMAINALEKVRSGHTYEHRIRQMLAAMEEIKC